MLHNGSRGSRKKVSFNFPCSGSDCFIVLCFKPQFRFNTMPNEIIHLCLAAYFYLIYLTAFCQLRQPQTGLCPYGFVPGLAAARPPLPSLLPQLAVTLKGLQLSPDFSEKILCVQLTMLLGTGRPRSVRSCVWSARQSCCPAALSPGARPRHLTERGPRLWVGLCVFCVGALRQRNSRERGRWESSCFRQPCSPRRVRGTAPLEAALAGLLSLRLSLRSGLPEDVVRGQEQSREL